MDLFQIGDVCRYYKNGNLTDGIIINVAEEIATVATYPSIEELEDNTMVCISSNEDIVYKDIVYLYTWNTNTRQWILKYVGKDPTWGV